jgi:hypothetical protein
MTKISNFDKALNQYITNINENYNMDRIEGFFYLVYTSYIPAKKFVYNRLTFKEFYFVNQVYLYCSDKLIVDWDAEYHLSDNLKIEIYSCYKDPNSSAIEYRSFADGHIMDKRFYYRII